VKLEVKARERGNVENWGGGGGGGGEVMYNNFFGGIIARRSGKQGEGTQHKRRGKNVEKGGLGGKSKKDMNKLSHTEE